MRVTFSHIIVASISAKNKFFGRSIQSMRTQDVIGSRITGKRPIVRTRNCEGEPQDGKGFGNKRGPV